MRRRMQCVYTYVCGRGLFFVWACAKAPSYAGVRVRSRPDEKIGTDSFGRRPSYLSRKIRKTRILLREM